MAQQNIHEFKKECAKVRTTLQEHWGIANKVQGS